ncbi:MAG TPA: PIN domain nuclease [Nitrospiraceae bacterium]|nr:PIN domain nuclease [Nitrospiraceae bacterium]
MNVKGPFVFDSHALLKFFQKERGHEKVARLLRDIQAAGRTKYLNAINLGEIIYTTKRVFGDQQKIAILAHIERLGFTILPVPNTLIFQAAEYKAQYSISFADCFALASAVEQKAPIVTGDPEFRKVAELVEVVWV